MTAGAPHGDRRADVGISAPLRRREADLVINLADEVRNQTNVVYNISQDVVITTRDKIDLALRKTLPRFANRQPWLAPASFLASLLLGVLTADFNAFLGIPATAWTTVFVLGLIAAAVWLVIAIQRTFRRLTHDQVVQAIVDTNDPATP